MYLLIDIGNTNTQIAVARGKKIVKRYFIHTSKENISQRSLKRLLGEKVSGIDKVVIVSVVPAFLKILKNTIKVILPKAEIKVVGKDIKVPIKNRYKDPKQVGQDRLVTAHAAAVKFGKPIVSIDFGTAVTFDFVNKKGEYEGGLIFPGLRIALNSLEHEAALLPKIDIRPTKTLIGKDTQTSMNNGVLHGYAGVCDEIIEKFRKKYGPKVKVVATGGDAKLVAKYSKHVNKVTPDLIFTGLKLLT